MCILFVLPIYKWVWFSCWVTGRCAGSDTFIGWHIWVCYIICIEIKMVLMSVHCSQSKDLLDFTRTASVFNDPSIAKHPSHLHDKYVIVSVDKPPNNIVFECKWHYIHCLIKEFGIDNSLGNPTYTSTKHTKEEILDNYRSVLCSFGISTKDEGLDLRIYRYSTEFINYKCPYKKCHIGWSAKCSTKPLSWLLTK